MIEIEEIPYAIQDYRNEGFDVMALPELLYVVTIESPDGEGCEAWQIGEKTDALMIDEKPFWTVDHYVDEHGEDVSPCGYDVEVYFKTFTEAEDYALKLRASGYAKIDCYEIDREDYCRAYLFRSDNSIAEDRQPRKVEVV